MAAVLGLGGSPSTVHGGQGGCGSESTPAEMMADRRWVDSDRTLFVIDVDGRLSQRRLDGSIVKVFPPHGFADPPHIEVSADGRFATYQGRLRNRGVQQFWLVDLAAGTERLLLETAPWHFGLPEFSPDGRWVALELDFDDRNADNSDEGLHLFGTTVPGHFDVGRIPVNLMPEDWRVVSPRWSADGETLLFMGFDDANRRIYYAWSPVPNGTFERINGSWNEREADFVRQGVPIPTAESTHPPARRSHGRLESSDGKWVAEVDDEFRLLVHGNGDEPLHAATGAYDQCVGWTLGIHAWLDDRFLIYSLDSTPYLLEASTGRQVPLFEDADSVSEYFWEQ